MKLFLCSHFSSVGGKNANGESTYTLTYDKKTGLFNAAKNA